MFTALSEQLTGVLNRLRGRGVLSESDVTDALREIRRHLLEADVSFEVTRGFVERVRARTVIVDTAGRLQIDAEMMDELRALKAAVPPKEVLLVADGMTGQDAVKIARGFHEGVGLTGVILTKLDGDARGGAALSIHGVTGVPIDRKSTRLNSSHANISYAVFCLTKQTTRHRDI